MFRSEMKKFQMEDVRVNYSSSSFAIFSDRDSSEKIKRLSTLVESRSLQLCNVSNKATRKIIHEC